MLIRLHDAVCMAVEVMLAYSKGWKTEGVGC
jgi:hypothetical protein